MLGDPSARGKDHVDIRQWYVVARPGHSRANILPNNNGCIFHLQIVQKAGGSQEKTGKRRIRTKKQNRVERRGEHKERRLRRSESFTSNTRQGTRDG